MMPSFPLHRLPMQLLPMFGVGMVSGCNLLCSPSVGMRSGYLMTFAKLWEHWNHYYCAIEVQFYCCWEQLLGGIANFEQLLGGSCTHNRRKCIDFCSSSTYLTVMPVVYARDGSKEDALAHKVRGERQADGVSWNMVLLSTRWEELNLNVLTVKDCASKFELAFGDQRTGVHLKFMMNWS